MSDDSVAKFLSGPADAAPPDLSGEAARALCALLVEKRDAARLATLAARGSRDVAKEARRGIHLLRTKGVVAEAPRPAAAAPPPRATPAEDVEAWAAPPDGKGERIVSIVRAAPTGGYDQIHVSLSDEAGLIEVISGQGPRKAFRDLKRRFEAGHLAFAEIPVAHAQQLVAEAYERTLSLGRSPPPGFAAARGLIGTPPADAAAAPHPALAEVSPAEALATEDAAALLDLPDLLSWSPPRAVLETLSLRIDEIATSKLLVDDCQRHAARAGAIDQAVEASFDAAGRVRWRRRLLDAALIYARAGHEDDSARLRAQADRLAAPDFAPLGDGFARALVEKLLGPELRTGLVETPGTEPPAGPEKKLIVTP